MLNSSVRRARRAAEVSPSQGDREVNQVNPVNPVLPPRSKDVLAVDREPAIPTELALFGAEPKSEEVSSDGADLTLETRANVVRNEANSNRLTPGFPTRSVV